MTTIDRRKMLQGSAGLAALGMAGKQAGETRAESTAAQAGSAFGRAATMTSSGFDEARLERMREVMQGHVDSGLVPGLVSLVSRRGETHVDALGETAYEDGAPMERDTIFRIASVTKPIVAAAAMILVEECVLRLDDPVDALLPELANRQVLRTPESELDDTVPANRPITLRDLLTFRLGYGAIFTAEPTPIVQASQDAGVAPGPFMPNVPNDELMAAYGSLPLYHQPGEQWLYNSGADILGVLIARATDMSLSAFLQERIFEPLGMKDTGFFVPAGKLDRLANSYWTNFETGEYEVFDPVVGGRFASPPTFESGAGGLVSTVDDLLAFGEMMLNNGVFGEQRLLSRPSVELMTTDHITPEQKAVSVFFPETFWDNRGWGFGVSVMTRRDNLQDTPGRFGWDGGYGTSWYVDPKEQMIGILMTQHVWDGSGIMGTFNDFWTLAYQAFAD